MKITCQSCGAKYAIADEKVRGRTVKIRCRKCNTPIVVKGGDSLAPGPESQGAASSMAPVSTHDAPYASQRPGQDSDTQWMVAMDDGSQQGGTVDVVRELFQNGQIHENTYVWCDGMEDWLPLSSVPELWSVMQQAQASASAQPLQNPAAQAAAFPEPAQPLVPSPGAMSSGLFGSGGHAARVEPGKQYEDLFGAAQEKAEQEQADHVHDEHKEGDRPVVPRFTAERNENSVLFTIDSILSAGKGSPKKTTATEQEEEKVDFKRLASLPPVSFGGDSSSRFGAGAGFGQAALMAPMLPTTIEPDPIPEPVAPVVPDTLDTPPKAKSNRGLLIGLGVALVTLLIVVIAGGVYISNKDAELAMSKQEAEKAEALRLKEKQEREEKERAQRAEREEEEARARKKAEEEKAKAKEQVAENTEKTDEATDSKGKTDTSKAADTKGGSKLASALAAGAGGKDDKAGKTDTSSKPGDAPAAKPADTPAAPAGGGDRAFSRSAAVSALSAAANSAASCKKPDGPTGRGQVSVTFAPSGRVTTANVSGAFAGTSVGGCVASVFRRATVPPFDGSPVTVRKSFTIN